MARACPEDLHRALRGTFHPIGARDRSHEPEGHHRGSAHSEGCHRQEAAKRIGPMSVGPWLSAIRAAAAPIGGFPLLAVLVHVADEHPAAYAGVGSQASRPE